MDKFKDIIELKNRRIIYQLILNSPGLHLRGIIKKLNLSEGTIRYHLNYLKLRELIVEYKEDGYKRFYIKNKVGGKDRDLLRILRKEIPQNIALGLIMNMALSRVRISKFLEKHPKVVEYHLKKLLKAGIIEVAQVENGIVKLNLENPKYRQYNSANNEVIYILKDCNLIFDFFIVYEKSFLDNPIARDCIIWFKFIDGAVFPEKVKQDNKPEERLLEILFDIFPHPYHI